MFKILVVNDEIFQLEMCTLILKNIFNIQAETAMNGKIALDIILNNILEYKKYYNKYE